jgi:hypothetical protein
MANLEELNAVTLPPKFVHKFGDRPYFSTELNTLLRGEASSTVAGSSYFTPQQPAQIFLKFKSSSDGYTWGRITDVVECEDTYAWNGKQFRIKFAVQGEESLVSCVSISSKPLDQSDVREYLIRNTTAAQHRKSDDVAADAGALRSDDDVVVDYTTLPSTEVCTQAKLVIQANIVRRPISEKDVASLEEYATAMHVYPGNLAVKHTNTMLGNLRAETKVGHTTSYHETGFSTKAHTRRLADKNNASVSLRGGGDASQLLSSQSQLSFTQLSQSQDDFGSFATTQPMLSPAPESPFSQSAASPSSQQELGSSQQLIDAARFLEAKRNEEIFRDYIGAPERTGFVDFLAEKTRHNAALNAKATVLAMSNGTKQKSNMIQSTGLWITDDAHRRQTAEQYLGTKGESGEEEKKKDAAPKKASAAAAGGAAAVVYSGAAAVAASSDGLDLPKRSTSVVSRADLQDAFSSQRDSDDDWTTSASLPTTPLTHDASTPRPAVASPNVLAAGVSPLSQLVFHASASSQHSISRKRSREDVTA